MTFATLTAGTDAAITVIAGVPGTGVLNAWIDFNADGDWDDTGEKIISDQAVTNGTNNLTATIAAGAAAGQVFARFRITTDVGHSYSGLARDGEVEDYQVVLIAARSSSSRIAPAVTSDLWAAAFVDEPNSGPSPNSGPRPSSGPDRQIGESDWNRIEPTAPDVVDWSIVQGTSTERTITADLSSLQEHLVDQIFEDEETLLHENGFGL